VERFRAAVERKDFEHARTYFAPDARLWYENRSGAGAVWKVGGGTWATWDAEFNSRSKPIAPYRSMRTAFGPAVWTIVEEDNDFYRLIDRPPGYMMFTWYVAPSGKLSGFLLAGIGERTDRLEEFEAWAREHEPAELEYLMPGGKIDPTGDRAARFRNSLNRWRSETGLPGVGEP